MPSIGLRNGLIGGALVIAYFGLLYAFCLPCFLHPVYQWGVLLLYALLLVWTAVLDGRAHDFDRIFRERVRAPFLTFLVANVLYWIFYYALHLADPNLLAAETAQQLEYLQAQLKQGTGDPAASAQLREQIAYLQKEGMSMPLGPVLLQVCMSAIGGFGLAAAAAALSPLFQPDDRG